MINGVGKWFAKSVFVVHSTRHFQRDNMKLNINEAHDRLIYFKKDQEANIFQGAEDCLKKNHDSLFYQDRSPYVYIFAHPRTADDGVTKRLLWQPRLLKPEAQTNSYLFRAISHTDLVETIWFIPPFETWYMYQKGKLTEHDVVIWSIDQYMNNRKRLEARDPQDLIEEKAKKILQELIDLKRFDRMMKNAFPEPMQESLEEFSISS